MKYIIAVFVGITNAFLCAQNNVANLNNVPVLLHPSLVGSSEGKRATVAYGVGNSSIGKDKVSIWGLDGVETNYLNLSYDQMWKKTGSGIGGYINVSSVPNQSGATSDYMEPYSKLKSAQWASGIAFAPKYIIMKKGVPDQIRFTWSPSLSVNYNRHWAIRSIEVPENNNDYLVAYTSKDNYYHQTINAQLGGLLNNKTLLLGATMGYSNYQSSYKIVSSKSDGNDASFKGNYLDYAATIGISFPRKEKSLLGFSYTLKFAGSHYLGKVSGIGNRINLYGNINLRIWKIVTGFSSGSFNNSIYIGYKAKKWKATIGIRKTGYDKSYSFGETIFAYNF